MNVRTLAALLAATALVPSAFTSSAWAIQDGTTAGVIAPTFYSTAATGTNSYIRLFSGAGTLGTLSTFNITLEGYPSGAQAGQSFTINVPYMASVQYSIGQLLGFANAGAAVAGDTGYAVYLRNSDVEAGWQHVTYNPVSQLFENMSNCASSIGERMFPLHNLSILTNVHSSKVAGNAYPSTIYIYNQSPGPNQYTIDVFNSGNPGASGASVSSTAGKYTCEYQTTMVQPNSMLAIPESTLETATGCTIDSDQSYSTIAIQGQNSTAAIITHLVRASAYSGDINLTDVCAVNRATLSLTPIPFISSVTGSSATTFSLSGQGSIQAVAFSGLSQAPSGAPVVTGSTVSGAAGSVLTSATGFKITIPDGKSFTYNTTPQTQNFQDIGHYKATADGGGASLEVFLNARRAATLTYSTFGYWIEQDSSGDNPLGGGTFATGVATAATAVPAAGSLNYAGRSSGILSSGSNTTTVSNGGVSLTLNFNTKTVTGTVTNVAVTTIGDLTTPASSQTNMLNLTGTITGGTFTGTVTTGPAVTGSLMDISGATGTFSGTITGPQGFEAVGNIFLNLGSGGVGGFVSFGVRSGGS